MNGNVCRYAPLVAAAAAVPITFVVSRTIMLRPESGVRAAQRVS